MMKDGKVRNYYFVQQKMEEIPFYLNVLGVVPYCLSRGQL